MFDSMQKELGWKLDITMAYYPDGRQERWLSTGGAVSFVDYFHMMTYDQTGAIHSTYDFAIKSIKAAIDLGLPPNKLTVGLPFYGRNSQSGDWTTYEDILLKYDDFIGEEVDIVPAFDSETAFIGFNNKETITKKVSSALQLSLGGIMIWEVGQDCRLAPVTRNGATHVRTCPRSSDSLLVAIAGSILNHLNMNNSSGSTQN